jgi:hypothetical protein
VLSKSKLCWAQTKIEYLGLILSKGEVELQDHVLKKLSDFPDEILDQKQLQRFLGCLNYIRQFYENQAKDVRILQKRLSKALPWNYKMTQAVQIIKQKIQNLPKLYLPDMTCSSLLKLMPPMIHGQQFYCRKMVLNWKKFVFILLDVSVILSQDILPLIRKFLLSKMASRNSGCF